MKKVFFTNLFIPLSESEQPQPPFKGKGWDVDFIEARPSSEIKNCREVIIKSQSLQRAQYVLNLILSSITLIKGTPLIVEEVEYLVAYNDEEPIYSDFTDKCMKGNGLSTLVIPIACEIAAKASRKHKWVYALTKYKFSVSLYGVFFVDLDPHSSQHLPVSPFPEDHINFSHSIISAHSVIEDLGLEIRANQKKPSKMKNGKWNPVVKADLENRLKAANINLNESILWTIRGPKRKIEKKRGLPRIDQKTSWARGDVRDAKIRIIDAIHYIDWLRDCVASHSVKELTKVLSPYDVVNSQHLARRLILESLGYWQYNKNL